MFNKGCICWWKNFDVIKMHGTTIKIKKNYIWNEEVFPRQSKESIRAPIHNKDNKCHCSSWQDVSLTNCVQILTQYFPLSLTLHMEECFADPHCEFRWNNLNTYQIFCSHQMLQKKWEENGHVCQQNYALEDGRDLIRKNDFYVNIFITWGMQ